MMLFRRTPNAYKCGMVSGRPAIEADNRFGMTTPQESIPERMKATFIADENSRMMVMVCEVGASAYAAVRAEKNTRESFWGAMQRKETYENNRPIKRY